MDPGWKMLHIGEGFHIEINNSRMEEDERVPGSVFTSENGRWDSSLFREWQGRPLVEDTGLQIVVDHGHVIERVPCYISGHIKIYDSMKLQNILINK